MRLRDVHLRCDALVEPAVGEIERALVGDDIRIEQTRPVIAPGDLMDGLPISERAAARRFGIDPRTVNKMMKFSVPPGYKRKKPPANSYRPAGQRPVNMRANQAMT